MKYAIIVFNGPDDHKAIGPFHSHTGADRFLETQVQTERPTAIIELHNPKDFVADMHWEVARKAARKAVQK